MMVSGTVQTEKGEKMRLIDADALIETLETQDYSNAPDTLEEWTPQDLTNAEIFDINNAPTVDAVEVVRCEDCRKYIPCQKLPIGTSKWCDMFDRATCEMNYCGWGERREDGEIG